MARNTEEFTGVLATGGRTEADAVAEIARVGHAPVVVSVPRGTADTAAVLLAPEGMKAHDVTAHLDKYMPRPRRRKGTAEVGDLESFIAHASRFADADSALFASADPKHPSLTAVLDYHEKQASGGPRFGEHRTHYDFPLSEEWQAWTGRDDHPMLQSEFASFIEDRIADILDPTKAGPGARDFAYALGCELASPSKLMELSRGLSVRANAKVHNAVNLSSGEMQLQFVTQHTDESGAPIKVPGAFLIGIPVFHNGEPYQIAVRLRYRLREDKVSWFYSLHRPDRCFDHAFGEACEKAKNETGLPLFVGSPEA